MAAQIAHSVGAQSIDARLHLSLDDLIKERKKENKKEVQQKKRDNVKQEKNSAKDKGEQKKKAADAQADKRKAKMNKNRGLPAPEAKTQDKPLSASAKKLKRKKAKLAEKKAAAAQAASQSKKAKKSPLKQQESKKQKQPTQQPQKQTNQKQQMNQKQQKQKQNAPALSPKQQKKKAVTVVTTVVAKTAARQVVQSGKKKGGAKLEITLKRSKADVRRAKKKQATKQVPAKAAKTILPGKSQPKTRQILAQKIVKKAKTSRKQTSKNGKFIVRKPATVRKA